MTYCSECETYYRLAELRQCYYHPSHPYYVLGSNKGMYYLFIKHIIDILAAGLTHLDFKQLSLLGDVQERNMNPPFQLMYFICFIYL